MPWEKEFDVDLAIDRATAVFWSKGYVATSLSDLLSATGINRGSFYNAFGSKKKMFIVSLTKYDNDHRKAILQQLYGLNNPTLAISTLFDELIEQSLTDKNNKGCMLVNTALDLPNHTPDVAKIVDKSLKEFEQFFVDQISLGIKIKTISNTKNIESCAKGLMSMIIGLRVLARGIYTSTDLEQIKKQALSLIG